MGPTDFVKGVSSDAKWNVNLDRYLSGLPTDRHWSVELRSQVAALRKLKPRKYDLRVCSIEVHLEAGRGLHPREPRYFVSFGELGDYLVSPIDKALKSRLICFSRHEDRPDRDVGGRKTREQTQLQALVAAKLVSLLGCIWDIDYETVDLLAGYPANGDEPVSARSLKKFFKSYDIGNDQSGPKIVLPFVQTVSTTCPPPKYGSDTETLTSSHYTKPPRQDSVTIFYDNRSQITKGYWRGILACSTSSVMDLVVHKFTKSSPADQASVTKTLITRSLLRQVNEVIESQTRSNLASVKLFLLQMQYLTRRDPSHLKPNYVIHLQDHIETINYMVKEKSVMIDTDWSACTQEPWDQEWLQKFSGDIVKLSQIASDLQVKANSIYKTARDQVSGKDSARNKLFAALAAIYLPFTLSTGVLGMNIKEINGDGHSRPRWWVLIVLGLPLALVTVALPLCFDSINRSVHQYARVRPVTYKRGIIIVPIVIIVIIIAVVVTLLLVVTMK